MKNLNPYVRSLLICIPIGLLTGIFLFHEHTTKDITSNVIESILVAVTVTSLSNNRTKRIKGPSTK